MLAQRRDDGTDIGLTFFQSILLSGTYKPHKAHYELFAYFLAYTVIVNNNSQ